MTVVNQVGCCTPLLYGLQLYTWHMNSDDWSGAAVGVTIMAVSVVGAWYFLHSTNPYAIFGLMASAVVFLVALGMMIGDL